MSRRGIENNPWNVPQDELDEWTERFTISEDAPTRLLQFDNIPEELMSEDDLISEDSQATTILMDIDDDDDDVASLQQQDISSTTPTISTLNMINLTEIKRRNLWVLQPALNSIYDNLTNESLYHYKRTVGDYQMEIPKIYNNALLTPLSASQCLVQSRHICPMASIQGSLYHIMLAMKNYERLKAEEKDSLIRNFGYLSELIKNMEAGFKAQREWNIVIQSLLHNTNHSDRARDLEYINLMHQVKKATMQCPELPINDQPSVTTIFDQYQKATPASITDCTEKEIDAHRIYNILTEIEEMIKYVGEQ